jgi:hypothetical protein
LIFSLNFKAISIICEGFISTSESIIIQLKSLAWTLAAFRLGFRFFSRCMSRLDGQRT